MLVSIQCDQFKTKDPIIFHKGLNTIVGDGNNSIGKSTLLMIIDYCFGGDDYFLKEKNILNAIGPHDIKFVFDFDGTKKHFIRNSNDKNTVKVCDEKFNVKNTITIESFREGLLTYYSLKQSGLTFRSYISPYFRIYNRGTHNELKPLNATVHEADESGVICLLKMYGKYQEVQSVNDEYQKAVYARDSLNALIHSDVAPIAKNKKEAEAIQAEVDELRKELTQIELDNDSDTSQISLLDEARAQELRDEKAKLDKEKSALKRKLNKIKFDGNYYDDDFQTKFIKLKQFFPDIDLEEIKKIEIFHSSISTNLEEEANRINNEINELIALLDKQIEEIVKKLNELGVGKRPTVSRKVLSRYKELSLEIDTKEKAIANFEKLNKAKENLTAKKEARDKAVAMILRELSKKINDELVILNDNIRADLAVNPPVINLQNFETYSFQITDDTGTGSRFKSVCMLDTVLLKQTALPAIAHDSIMFANINPGACVDLFKQYIQLTNKQIFVGVDLVSKFNDGDNPNLAWENRVFELGVGKDALFGRPINTRKIY